jgi:hypothetical protein
MFGSIFELRVNVWVQSCSSHFTLVPSSLPCLAVFILAVRAFHFHIYPLSSSLWWLPELPPDTRSEDVSKFFDGYGKIIDCRVMTGKSLSPSTFMRMTLKMDQALGLSSLKMLEYALHQMPVPEVDSNNLGR